MSIFAQLGTRIFGGLSVVLLLALAVQGIALKACHRHGAKVDAALSDANATIRQFQAAGERIEADRDKAIKASKAERATIQTKIERIVVPAPVAGCDTPPDVMGAFQ